MEFRPVTYASTSHPVPLKVRIAPEVLKIIAVVTAAFAYYSTSQMYLYAAAGALILSYIAEIIRNSRTPTSYYSPSLNSSASLAAPLTNAPGTPLPPVSPSTYIPAPPPLPTPSPAPSSSAAASLLPPHPTAHNASSFLPSASTQLPAARPPAPTDLTTAIRNVTLKKAGTKDTYQPFLKRSNSFHNLSSQARPEPTRASPNLTRLSTAASPLKPEPQYLNFQTVTPPKKQQSTPVRHIQSRRKDARSHSDSEAEDTPASPKLTQQQALLSTRKLFDLPVANGTSSPSKPLPAVLESSPAAASPAIPLSDHTLHVGDEPAALPSAASAPSGHASDAESSAASSPASPPGADTSADANGLSAPDSAATPSPAPVHDEDDE